MQQRKPNPFFFVSDQTAPWLVLLIVLCGLIVRLVFLNGKSLWLDEANAVRVSQLGQDALWAGRGEGYHPPLFYLILAGWTQLGNSESMLRLIGVIPASLTIPLSYLFAKKLFNREIALTTAALLAFSPLAVWYAQEVRPYALLAGLGLVVLLAGFYVLEEFHFGWWLLLVLGLCSSLYLHYAAFILIPLLLLLFNILHALQRSTWRAFVALLAAIALALASYWPWLQTPTAARFANLLTGDKNYIARLILARFGFLPFADQLYELLLVAGVLGILVIIFLAYYLTRWVAGNRALPRMRQQQSTQIFVVILYIIVLIVTVWPRGYSLKRQLVLLWPFVLLLFAWVWPWRPSRAKILAGILTLSLMASLINVLLINKPEWREVSAFIMENRQATDLVLLEPAYMRIPFNFYAQDQARHEGVNFGTDPADLELLLAKSGRIWFIVHASDRDLQQQNGAWLNAHTTLLNTTDFFGLQVRLYDTGQ